MSSRWGIGAEMKQPLIAMSLFLIAFALRFHWTQGFDGLYGQDAYAYYDFARAIQHTVLDRVPLPPFFWTLGYPLLLASSFSVFGASALVGQLLNVMLGALLAPMLYTLAKQIQTHVLGAILAGLLIAFCGQAIQSSIVIMSDTLALFCSLASALALVSYCQTAKPSRLYWMALFLALAVFTRWVCLLLAPIGLIVILWQWQGQIHWKESLLASLIFVLVLIPQVLFSIGNPYPSLNHEWLTTWDIHHALQADFVNSDGTFHYEQVNALFYAAPFYADFMLTALFSPLLVLGIIRLLGTRPRWQKILLILWLTVPYLFLIGIAYQNIRFALMLVPPVCILVGLGAEAVLAGWQFIKTRAAYMPPLHMVALICLIGYGLLTMHKENQQRISAFIDTQQSDKTIAVWLASRLPAQTRLYTFGLTLTLQHYTDLQVYEIYYETPESLDSKWQRGQADYLFVNLWVIANQWQGRSPHLVYEWLRTERGLSIIEQYRNYILFRVNG